MLGMGIESAVTADVCDAIVESSETDLSGGLSVEIIDEGFEPQ